MIDAESLKQLFPREQDIPADYRLLAPIHQRTTLIDGVLEPWGGDVRTVRSAVCVRHNGELPGRDRQRPARVSG